jgi:hypothetical protein
MILDFENFLVSEAKKKWTDSTHPYFKGLSKSTAKAKKSQMKKQASMDDSDADAYKEMPGDVKAKKSTRTSKHTKKYQQMYGS